MSGSMSTENLRGSFSTAVADRTPRKTRRLPPVSIRFSEDERAALQHHAGSEPLGPYIKRCVLRRHGIAGKPRRKSPSRQQGIIARTLRGLGGSGVSGVLSSFLLAFEEGRLVLDHTEEAEQRQAAAEVTAMRNDLVSALGLREDGGAQ